ncbi:hypothetical protein JL100_018150 [Skermanella mucosa]|uniref:hypothetical protein n=1 Tax=Skermanella mucosa TaxID=1789672 RepID=UPI00192BAB9B|nr:hypothetical protein [Skermanella mucosa]UEM19009.1 hypothetical protein JL100_018150 [Skermanella mucosa]
MNENQFKTLGERIAYRLGRSMALPVSLVLLTTLAYVLTLLTWNVVALLNRLFGGMWL